MRIHSLSKVLAFPFAIAFAIFLFFSLESGEEMYSYGLIPPVIIIAIIIVLSPQIDFWWYQKHPPALDIPIRSWLVKHHRFYNSLNAIDRTKFENRLSLFLKAKAFSIMGEEKNPMPEDLKAIIASNAIQISFNHEEFLFEGYDHIIAYQHPFPSPDILKLHAIETNHEDGVILLSLEQFIPSMLNPALNYNIGMHAFVDAWLNIHQSKIYNEIQLPSLEELNKSMNMKTNSIPKLTGIENTSMLIICSTLFHEYPTRFQQVFPNEFEALKKIFAGIAN